MSSVKFDSLFSYNDCLSWSLTEGILPETRVEAYRLSSRYHMIGASLVPHRAIVYRGCSYDFGDGVGYFVTTFNSVKYWVDALHCQYTPQTYLYRLEFAYKDLVVCHLNADLTQGFVRGNVVVKNRCIIKT